MRDGDLGGARVGRPRQAQPRGDRPRRQPRPDPGRRRRRRAAPGPGVGFVAAVDVVAVDLAIHDPSLRGQLLEVAGPEHLTFTQLAERLITASGKPGRTSHIPLPMLRAMSVLARPVSPVFARQAQAAVLINTTDMTVDPAAIRSRLPTIPATPLDQVLRRQPPLQASR